MLPGFAERISYLGICLPNSDISWGKESLTIHAGISKILHFESTALQRGSDEHIIFRRFMTDVASKAILA
jgi:hypothetical protein